MYAIVAIISDTFKANNLNACVATEVEVKLCRVRDSHIHGSTSRNVARLPTLVLLLRAEETCVMSLLNYHERYPWFVVGF